MLTVEHVTKVFNVGAFGGKRLRAVHDVNFEVKPGEVLSLIGESGSGKTTIGKMILRLSGVTEGAITFDGTDISTLSGHDLKTYYGRAQGVFQDPFSSFNPIFKADRVFAMIRQEFFPHVGGTEWGAKVGESLEDVGLNPRDVLNKYPHQLSGGQLQRLLIARALLLEIKLLVADEIISMLDASTRIDVLNLLADLKTRGLSIVFITHDLSLGNYISDRTVILRHGAIVEMGSTATVFGDPRHPYTKMLLDAVPQLHRKWEEGDAFAEASRALAAAAAADLAGGGGGQPLVQVAEDHFVAANGAAA